MKKVAMIPIKLNNERIPGKNLKCFSDGIPLINLIQNACLHADVDKVYVYCSSEGIKEYLVSGVEFLKRPQYLDSDSSNCNDIIRAFLAKRIQEFLWSEGKTINFDIQNFPRTQDLTPVYSETPGAYVFLKETFFKYDRRVGINPYIHEVSEIESRDIDYPEDFLIADAIYTEIIKSMDSSYWGDKYEKR